MAIVNFPKISPPLCSVPVYLRAMNQPHSNISTISQVLQITLQDIIAQWARGSSLDLDSVGSDVARDKIVMMCYLQQIDKTSWNRPSLKHFQDPRHSLPDLDVSFAHYHNKYFKRSLEERLRQLEVAHLSTSSQWSRIWVKSVQNVKKQTTLTPFDSVLSSSPTGSYCIKYLVIS